MSEQNVNQSTPTSSTASKTWEQDVLEKLATSALKEQRVARRWSIFFKALLFIYLFVFLFYGLGLIGPNKTVSGDHTAVIDIVGVIEAGGDVDADTVITSLREAYEDEGTKGIILRVNSPGGSPVQSGIINDEMQRLKTMYPKIPIYAVVEDICASGGYYIAVAADKIFVDKGSIVGSIGVLMDGYGFTELMKKVGVERRLLTAGTNKAMLDPFSPVNPQHVEFAQTMLNEIHEQFKTVVRKGRGDRLKETPETFSGLFWSGEQGVAMGLADAFGSADYVAREIIKEENMIDYTYQDDFATKMAKKFGASVSQTVSDVIAKQLIKSGEVKLH